MQQPTTTPADLVPAFVFSVVLGAVATFASVWVMVQMTPPCPGPWCLYVLIYLPLSAIGAGITGLVIGGLARRGWRGALAGFLGAAAGYGAVWYAIINGWLFAS